MTRMRIASLMLPALLLGACSSGGINAGEQGGMAFVAFAVMLVITVVILYFAIGRRD